MIRIEKYYLEWCKPCNLVQRHFDKLNLKVEQFEMSDIKKRDRYIRNKKLTNVPTIIFYKWEKEIARLNWEISEKDILAIIK